MRLLAKRRWKRYHAAACAKAKSGDLPAALALHQAALDETSALGSKDRRQEKTLEEMLRLKKKQGDLQGAIEIAESLLQAKRRGNDPTRSRSVETLLELAALHLETGSQNAAVSFFEAALDSFRKQTAALLDHEEAVRRFREERGSGDSLLNRGKKLIKLSVTGLHHVGASLRSLALYPQTLEDLTSIRISEGNASEAIALQRELINFKVANDLFDESHIMDDLFYVLSLQVEHGLIDEESPRLAVKYLELVETAEDELESSSLLNPLALVEATSYALGRYEDALAAARRGFSIASASWSEHSAETLRWHLLIGRASYALGDYREARQVSQVVMEQVRGNQEARRAEFRWALELDANAERALLGEGPAVLTGELASKMMGPAQHSREPPPKPEEPGSP